MDIGGPDIVLEGKTHPCDLWFLLSQLYATWPRGRYHESEDHRLYPLFLEPQTANVFAYKDREAVESWEKDGRTNDDWMIQIIVEPDQITIVGPETLSAPLFEGLRELRRLFAGDGWDQPVLRIAWACGLLATALDVLPWEKMEVMAKMGLFSARLVRTDGIVRSYWRGRARGVLASSPHLRWRMAI